MTTRRKPGPVAAIIAFCDLAPFLHAEDGDVIDAYRALIQIANERRPPGRACRHQNVDYPHLRCSRRHGHKGRHAMPSKGASW